MSLFCRLVLLSELGETTFDVIVVPKNLLATRSQSGKAPQAQHSADVQPILPPPGHKMTTKHNHNPPDNEVKPAEQVFLVQHGLSKSALKYYRKESRFNDWQFLKTEFSALVESAYLCGC